MLQMQTQQFPAIFKFASETCSTCMPARPLIYSVKSVDSSTITGKLKFYNPKAELKKYTVQKPFSITNVSSGQTEEIRRSSDIRTNGLYLFVNSQNMFYRDIHTQMLFLQRIHTCKFYEILYWQNSFYYLLVHNQLTLLYSQKYFEN